MKSIISPIDTVLPNGFHLVAQKTPSLNVAATLRVEFGAINERSGEEGLAHFLEHAVINGGTYRHSPEEQDQWLSELASSNASTSHTVTNYTMKGLADDLEGWLTLAADMVFHPRLDAKRVDQERQRILQEIARGRNTPAYPAHREYQQRFLGEHPFTREVDGEFEVVERATREDLLSIHERGYKASHMVLFIAGKIPQRIERTVNRIFGGFPCHEYAPQIVPPVRGPSRPEIINANAPDLKPSADRNNNLPQSQITIGFLTEPAAHPDTMALDMLRWVMGYGPYSRLHQRLSREQGLCYHVSATQQVTLHYGSIETNGKFDAARTEHAVQGIFDVMQALKDEKIPKRDLDRVIRSTQHEVTQVLESTQGMLNMLSAYHDIGLYPEMILQRMRAATPEQLQGLAQHYLPDRENGKYVQLIRNPLQ